MKKADRAAFWVEAATRPSMGAASYAATGGNQKNKLPGRDGLAKKTAPPRNFGAGPQRGAAQTQGIQEKRPVRECGVKNRPVGKSVGPANGASPHGDCLGWCIF